MDDLAIFMPTSPAPWHPSTDITEKAIASYQTVLRKAIPPRIYCDYPAPWVPPKVFNDYSLYLDRLASLFPGCVIRQAAFGGLVSLVQRFLNETTLPFLFNMQHDWEFVDPKRIDIDRLMDTFRNHPEVQCVRFHKRTLPQSGHYVDRHYWAVTDYPVPLIATDGWGDSPHIASLAHYRKFVEPNLQFDHGPDGRFGVEWPVWRKYRQLIRRIGLTAAQRRWGCFLYGCFNEPGFIQHLGDSAGYWRAELKIPKKRS